MNELIEVTLDYRVDEGPVHYTRSVTQQQLGELIAKLDELADESEDA